MTPTIMSKRQRTRSGGGVDEASRSLDDPSSSTSASVAAPTAFISPTPRGQSGDDTSINIRRKNARFVLNIGGQIFSTSKQTLICGSAFFSAAFQGQFSDGEDEDAEYYVDRCPDVFPILLKYMRSNLLVCNDRNLLAEVLIEAEFFGIDILLEEVKLQCYANLHSKLAGTILTSNEVLAEAAKEFPTTKELVSHKQFPAIYYEVAIFNKVISTEMLPEDTYVEYGRDKRHWRAYQMATYQRGIDDPEIIVEPLVRLESRLISWNKIDFRCPVVRWDRVGVSSSSQIVPLSFALKNFFLDNTVWSLVHKKHVSFEKGMDFEYMATVDGKEKTLHPSFLEIKENDRGEISVEGYGFTTTNQLINVREFSNFLR